MNFLYDRCPLPFSYEHISNKTLSYEKYTRKILLTHVFLPLHTKTVANKLQI